MSSYANHFSFLQHIEEELILLDGGRHLKYDGELYVHGWTREKIHSIVSRDTNPHPETTWMEFHIFDLQEEFLQFKRLALLKALFEEGPTTNSLKLVPTSVGTPESWTAGLEDYTSQGYEGIILRHINGVHVPKRTFHILKYKPTEKDEYEILGTMEAISQDGLPKGMVGAFLVSGDDGTTFEVGAGKLKHWQRAELWDRRDELPGLTLVVKHEKLKTINSVPVAAVAVEVQHFHYHG
jgi:ATP-dependent DNA ligase